MKKVFAIAALLLSVNSTYAQLQKTIHKTFPLDSAETVELDLYGDDYVIETWAGDNILTETKIKLYNASKNILNFFLERGRYEIQGKMEESILILTSKNKNRPPIKNKDLECHEVISLRIFMPDTFAESGATSWTKIQ